MKEFKKELEACGDDYNKLCKKNFYKITISGTSTDYVGTFYATSEEDLEDDSNKLMKTVNELILKDPDVPEEFNCEIKIEALDIETYFKDDPEYIEYKSTHG